MPASVAFPLRDVLLQPAAVSGFTLADWDSLVQQARSAGLLGRVAALLRESKLDDQIPDAARWHLEGAHTVYLAHCEDIRLEVQHIVKALAVIRLRPVLLKGAAYLAAGDRAVLGRLYSDVDIFVPRDKLQAAEQVLRWQGWAGEALSDYDQAYYRRWMHEIPALSHRTRGISLDVHHNLLPLTSRVRLDADALIAGVTPSLIEGVDTLAPTDRVLHSAAHLFLSGEFDNAFRDLSDLRLLLEQMTAADPAFWGLLLARAEELGLGRILFYALRYLGRLMALEVPPGITAQLQHQSPAPALRWLMDEMFMSALLPESVAGDGLWPSAARFALYVRSHYLKMPFLLLVRHLGHKAFITPFEKHASD